MSSTIPSELHRLGEVHTIHEIRPFHWKRSHIHLHAYRPGMYPANLLRHRLRSDPTTTSYGVGQLVRRPLRHSGRRRRSQGQLFCSR
ncbi:hypothetical protein ANCCAN_30053 [Ancylostoma caninum]|uniref:Uncharacterized protein n=1 Tax=Ancylostoma caninum TaxID=29170 RepID=A0A368EZY0_ANCCA|nr:hypothetical protein ANCCAN_30053 [Ancylostoma caninum]